MGFSLSEQHLWLGAAFAVLAIASPARAQDSGEVQIADASNEIIIVGEGLTRQGQSLGAAELQEQAPGTSPIKLVQRLPGVAFSGADAFGAYEWAVRINIRGFAQNQLGFTLDGVPLGDMSYGNHNGLHISRALISENLGRVELSQGSGSLDVAATNQLGGSLRFFSVAPDDEFGGVGALTVGSDETLRGFVRLDTGALGEGGPRAWVSYMDSSMDLWKGEGEQNQKQAALRIDQPIGEGLLTGYYNHSERREQDYQDFSLGMFNRLGYDVNNFGLSQYALAVQVADIGHNRGDTGQPVTNAAAGTVYPAPIGTIDDRYLDASGLRDDDLGYIKLDLPVGDMLAFSLQAYKHTNEGQGLWGTPYQISPNATDPLATTANAPFSIRTTEYDIDRSGLIGSVTLSLGDHEIEGGVWYQTNDFNVFRRFYALDRAGPNRDFLEFQSNPFFTQWGYAFETETLQLYLRDTWKPTETLTLSYGFRAFNVENTVRTQTINNAAPVVGADSNLQGTIEVEENFLPQIGFTYVLNDQTELFGSYAKNVAAWNSVVFGATPFSSRSQANFEEVRRSADPEEADVFEGGVRMKRDGLQFSAAAYLVKFDNRLLAIAQGPGIVGNAPVVSNVGAVETRGIELLAAVDLGPDWNVLAAYTFNDSNYEDDVVNRDGDLLAATSGKNVVNTPRNILHTEIAYDNGFLFGSVSTDYLGDRYFTYTNAGGKVDGRTIVDASLGLRFSGNAFLDGLEAQINVTNLFDTDYAGTVGTNGFVDAGDSQTLVAGAPRQVYLTLRKSF
jgi:iron complex outermembrane receptor protein